MVSRRRRRRRSGVAGRGAALVRAATLSGLAGSCLAVGPLYGQGDERPPEAVRELVEAERSFARYSVEHGVRPAFLRFLADDGIIFRPRPTNGKEWYANRANPAGTLDWAPAYAVVSASADMGWTTGPWEFVSSADSSLAYGHYVSVWRRQEDGLWRVAIDGGIVHGPEDPGVGGTVLRGFGGGAENGGHYGDTRLERGRLLATDRELARSAARDGLASAIEAVAAADLRLYRSGEPPVLGRQKAVEVLESEPGVLDWEPMSGAVSASHDLGYTFGIASTAPAPDGRNGTASYLRISSCDSSNRPQ